MQYYELGRTGLKVSALCFGTLPMGPLQAGIPVDEGGALILEALRHGVNFVDTAEMYQTNPHIRWALDRFDGEVVLATKSTAMTYHEMKTSVEKALNELKRDRIEIFHLHAARDNDPIANRAGALEALVELKQKGVIGAIGVANHSALGIARAAAEPVVDVVFALINRTGLGILDGGVPEMIASIQKAQAAGKGSYAMKALGGGNLLADLRANLAFVADHAGLPVIAVGMIRPVELEINLAIFNGDCVPESKISANLPRKQAKVLFMCKGCGQCIELCHNDAISIIEGKARIDNEKCLLCGYCSRECPQFAIRVV